MNKFYLILLSLIFLVSCQKENNSFTITGKMEVQLDSVGIWPEMVAKKFIDTTMFSSWNAVKDGQYYFEGEIPHPYIMTVYSPKFGVSEPFFIERGNTKVSVSFLDGDKTPVFANDTKSPTQIEYELLKSEKLDSLNEIIYSSKTKEEYKSHRYKVDTALINHLKENPNSYVVLWFLIDRFCLRSFEYYKDYEDALPYFSKEIQDTHAYKVFKQSLIDSKGNQFENKTFNFKDINLDEEVFDLTAFSNNKYVLLDFWFSHCGPCIAEMPKYKPIYDEYKDKGFEIISISIDKTKDISNWKKVIAEKEFDWVNYLDENGAETTALNIISFPTTFLINNKGEIVKKNIEAEALESFLNDSLN